MPKNSTIMQTFSLKGAQAGKELFITNSSGTKFGSQCQSTKRLFIVEKDKPTVYYNTFTDFLKQILS